MAILGAVGGVGVGFKDVGGCKDIGGCEVACTLL